MSRSADLGGGLESNPTLDTSEEYSTKEEHNGSINGCSMHQDTSHKLNMAPCSEETLGVAIGNKVALASVGKDSTGDDVAALLQAGGIHEEKFESDLELNGGSLDDLFVDLLDGAIDLEVDLLGGVLPVQPDLVWPDAGYKGAPAIPGREFDFSRDSVVLSLHRERMDPVKDGMGEKRNKANLAQCKNPERKRMRQKGARRKDSEGIERRRSKKNGKSNWRLRHCVRKQKL